MNISVNKSLCPQNHKCPAVKVCPVYAIMQEGFDLPVIDQDLCINCGKCISFCPMKAIEFK